MVVFITGIPLRVTAPLLIGGWFLVTFLSTASVCAAEATAEYFEGLRQRRLFDVAESYCLDRLARNRLSSDRRAELTLELSRTFTEHARYTSGPQQKELFSRAQQVIDEFLQDHPEHRQRIMMDVQRALIPGLRGDHLRWQTELFPYDETLRKQAASALTEAVSGLQRVEERLTEQLRRAFAREAVPPGELAPIELRRLHQNVRYQLGTARLNQAKLSEASSPERTSHLLDAEAWLRQLAGRDAGEEFSVKSRIRLAEISRLRGDFDHAQKLLSSAEKAGPPTELLDDVIAGRLRLLLAQDNPMDAAQLLVEYRKDRQRLPGELRYLKLKAVLALSQLAADNDDPDLADDLFHQAQTQVQRIERELGGFWGYRCRLLLEAAQNSRNYGPELARSIREAQAFYTAGQHDKAIEIYGDAAASAWEDGRSKLAAELDYTRASIQLEAGRYPQAADSFRELADRFPNSPRAADAHLLAAWCLGRIYQQERTDPRRSEYAEALRAHRRQFAGHPSAVEATWMLARLEETRGHSRRALGLYGEIPVEHDRGPAAQVAVARCYEALLDQLRDRGQPTRFTEREAIDRLTRWVSRPFRDADSSRTSAKAPSKTDQAQAESALRLARIHLNRQRPDYATADRLLQRVFEAIKRMRDEGRGTRDQETAAASRPSSLISHPSSLRKTAIQLRVVSLAGQGRLREARSLVRELSDSRASDVLSVLLGLVQLADRFDGETRRSLGELQLEAAQRLQKRRAELQPKQRKQLDRCRVQALLATNQPQRALDVYETSISQSPDDVNLLQTMAELLADSGTDLALRKAKSTWRTVESLANPGSPAWLQARYNVVRCAFALEQYDECRKLLGVTRLLYPELGGGALRGKFQQLQHELESR